MEAAAALVCWSKSIGRLLYWWDYPPGICQSRIVFHFARGTEICFWRTRWSNHHSYTRLLKSHRTLPVAWSKVRQTVSHSLLSLSYPLGRCISAFSGTSWPGKVSFRRSAWTNCYLLECRALLLCTHGWESPFAQRNSRRSLSSPTHTSWI